MNYVELFNTFNSQLSILQPQTLIDLRRMANEVGVTDRITIIKAAKKLEEAHPKEVLYLSTLENCLILLKGPFYRVK